MVKIVCPNCAADLEVPPNPIHTCDFCGTAIQVSHMVGPDGTNITGEKLTEEAKSTYIIKDHYIIRCHYNGQEVQSLMEDWVKKVPGAPQDFETTAMITSRELKFYPIWVGEYKASSSYVGLDNWPKFSQPAYDRPGWYEYVWYYKREEKGKIHREYQIPLMALSEKNIPKYLRNYTVTTTGKEFFDMTHVKELGGIVIDSVYTFDDAKKRMFNSVLNRQAGEMRKEVVSITNRNDNIEEQDVFYIHFPVYEFKFTYNNKKYKAYIDGSSGRVIHIDVPISTKFRLTTILTGAAHAVIGIGLFVAGIMVPAITFLGVSAGVGIFGTGMLFLAMNFRKGAQEKQT